MIICIIVLAISFVLGFYLMFKNIYEQSIKKYKIETEMLEKYDTILFCKKLFITEHYNKSTEICIIDLDDYFKKDIIRLNRFHMGPGDNDSLTRLIGPVAVCKVKGEKIWEYLEL